MFNQSIPFLLGYSRCFPMPALQVLRLSRMGLVIGKFQDLRQRDLGDQIGISGGKTWNQWMGFVENLNRKPWSFYHQIDRGFWSKCSHDAILWWETPGDFHGNFHGDIFSWDHEQWRYTADFSTSLNQRYVTNMGWTLWIHMATELTIWGLHGI